MVVTVTTTDFLYVYTAVNNSGLEIAVSGYFSFDENEEAEEELKTTMINQNAVAIIMPYLRSQVSLLTAQPEVECVVLPPFNIVKMMSDDN